MIAAHGPPHAHNSTCAQDTPHHHMLQIRLSAPAPDPFTKAHHNVALAGDDILPARKHT